MQKSILDAINDLKQPLKSVDQHNDDRRKVKEEADKKMRCTGVACPKCGDELKWVVPYGHTVMVSSNPQHAVRNAICDRCNLTIGLEA